MESLEWMESPERADRIALGMVVEATAAAPERCYGRQGRVRWIRRPEAWQSADNVPHKDSLMVLVCWVLGSDEEGRVIDATYKHRLTEIKLPDEEWDEDGDYPLAPVPDMVQMRMEVH